MADKRQLQQIEDAYQHDEVLADFLASLHRRPSKAAQTKAEERRTGRKSTRQSKAPPTFDTQEPATTAKKEYETPTEQNFLDTATDDDAVAISCLQHLSRAIPKLEREKSSDDMLNSSHRRTRVPMACTRCKMAHTRCDTKRPCGRCVRRGVADTCVDAIPKRRGRKRSEEMEVPMGRSCRARVSVTKANSESSESAEAYGESPGSDCGSNSWMSNESTLDEDQYRRRSYD